MKRPLSGTAVDVQHTLMETGVLLNESTLMEVSSAHPSIYPFHPINVLTVQVRTGKIQNHTWT